jgi:enamine deaminase RidA (YjgF/YER057c/UK114 family)
MRELLLAGFALLLASCATTAPPPVCYHANEKIEADIGYCQAVRSLGRLYISGAVGQGEMQAAVQSTYERLGRILAANGLSFANVVKENVYTTDLEAFKAQKELRKAFYGANLPAATWVEVRRLFLPQFVVEIELVAEERRKE